MLEHTHAALIETFEDAAVELEAEGHRGEAEAVGVEENPEVFGDDRALPGERVPTDGVRVRHVETRIEPLRAGAGQVICVIINEPHV